MANMNLKVTIAATGVPQQISKSFPKRTGGVGNLAETAQVSHFSDAGAIFAQWIAFQNQGSNTMYVGDSTTTSSPANGIELFATGSNTTTTPINYGTYLSDWWVAGTAGDVLFVLYIQ